MQESQINLLIWFDEKYLKNSNYSFKDDNDKKFVET